MEDHNQQSSNPPQAQPPNEQPSISYINSSQPKKVLQPSAELVQEVRTEQAERASAEASQHQTNIQNPAPHDLQSAATQTPQPPVTSAPTIDAGGSAQTSAPPAATSSIYPDPSKGIGGSVTAPTPTLSPAQAPEPTGNSGLSKRVLAVKIVAVTLILIDLSNAYDWYLAEKAGNDQWLTVIGIIVSLIFAFGIFRLKELARMIYVFASIVLLIIAGINYIQFYAATHNNASYQSNIKPMSKSTLESNIAYAKSNNRMTPQQKQAAIRYFQNELSADYGNKEEVDTKRYVSIALTLVVSVGPLVFLTRPSVKEVFTN